MSSVSLGDLAKSFMLRRHNVSLKQDLQRLTTELTTGKVSDTAQHVSGDLMQLSGIDGSLARLKGFNAITNEAGVFASAMQTALGTIDGLSSELSSSLLIATAGAADGRIDAVGAEARQKLETALSVLNTRFGDRSLFAGVQTSNSAVAGVETVLTALDTAVSGAVSAADVETAVSAWFDDPAGYAATGYLGGGKLAPLAIGAGEATQLDITANDPAIRGNLKALATAAMLSRGVLAGQPEARKDLARRAGSALLENQTDRTYLAARLGVAEAQIGSAATRNANELASLQIARNDIVSADPYETASKLEETQTQLEKIYTITARLSRLSLVDYLR